MGRFFSNVHIKNNVGRMKFINLFCDVMKKRGFTPCVDTEAALSYALAFSENSWVTLVNEDYMNNPKRVQDDLKYLADELKTSAFSVEVVDSDFAILSHNSGDKMIVGDGSGYGIEEPSRGNRIYWEPLLTSGKAWEQFTEIAQKDSAFVEDTLSELAVILGISPELICADYSELADTEKVVQLYFKKAVAKEKVMTLNTAFKQLFREALEPLGFKLIKSKYPYFVRVVGNEIIHVISVQKSFSYLHAIGREGFSILSGAATVYRPKIDLSKAPKHNTRWLSDIMSTYIGMDRFGFDSKSADSFSKLSYIENSFESQSEVMKLALKQTLDIVIPALNQIVDFDSFARFRCMMQDELYPERHFGVINGGDLNPNDVDDDGLVLFKVDAYSSYVDWSMEYRKNIYSQRVEYSFDKYSTEDFEEFCAKINDYKQQSITNMQNLKNDSKFYNLVELELEKRKRLNIEVLHSYGIDI